MHIRAHTGAHILNRNMYWKVTYAHASHTGITHTSAASLRVAIMDWTKLNEENSFNWEKEAKNMYNSKGRAGLQFAWWDKERSRISLHCYAITPMWLECIELSAICTTTSVNTCWIDVHLILILLLSLCRGIAQTPLKCFCTHSRMCLCFCLYMVHVTSHYLHRLRSIWSFFIIICANVWVSQRANERTSVCIIQTLTWALIFFKWEEIERLKKWIDYKNELFPTACDLPASVGLCYPNPHKHTFASHKFAIVLERDFNVLSCLNEKSRKKNSSHSDDSYKRMFTAHLCSCSRVNAFETTTAAAKVMCGLNQIQTKKISRGKKNSTLFNTSKKYFTVMYSLNQNRRYFCCSDVRLVHCKNWNSCGFQSPFCTAHHFSLAHSSPVDAKQQQQQQRKKRKQFQQQLKRREKFIGQIFSLVLFYFFFGWAGWQLLIGVVFSQSTRIRNGLESK